jgi:DNA-binding NarL/FixJ family response regulator
MGKYEKRVVTIAPVKPTEAAYQLADKLQFNLDHLTALRDLFPLLAKTGFRIDLIVFDLENLYNDAGTSIFDIISMVSTMSKCTLDKKTPNLAVLISNNTTAKVLDSISDTDIKGIIPRSTWLGIAEAEIAIRELLEGRIYMPKHIISIIKNKSKRSKVKPAAMPSGITLTPRQEQIIRLICNHGSSNKVIAKRLNISESTVKLHISAVLKKYGVTNRTQLALFADSLFKGKQSQLA